MTFTRRALVTFLTPVLLLLLSGHLLLPGVSDIVEGTHAPPENFGVLALGIMPFVAAYQVVEVVAFLVPSWSRRRHGDARFRAKLDLAVHFVALALAAMQAFAFAKQLEMLGNDSAFDVGHVSMPLVMVTLVGGVCLQVVAAKTITRMGLANGVAVLLGASVVVQVYYGILARMHPASTQSARMLDLFASRSQGTPMDLAVVAGATVVVVLATVVALARAGGMSLGSDETTGGPYRGARALVLHPSFPVPSSSYGAYGIARGLLVLPTMLATFRIPGAMTLDSTLRSGMVTFFGILVVATVALTFLLHRPKELADLSARLGMKSDSSRDLRALLSALPPTFLLFVVMALASQATAVSLGELPLAVAVLLDIVHSSRLARGEVAWTPVWEERRATAVPVLRAVLAARGIETRVTGMSLLWLMQLFAPFAPAVLLVKEEDRERAQAALGTFFALAEDAEHGALDAGPAAEPITLDAPALAPRRRAVYLGALVVAAAVVMLVGTRLREGAFETAAPRDVGPPAQIEIVRVDDLDDPLAAVRDEDLPAGSGISIYRENAPVGGYETKEVHWARAVAREGEPRSETRARLMAFLGTVKLAPSSEPRRFAVETVEDVDPETRKVTFIGYRSFLLTGAPELTNADVDDAMVIVDRDTGDPSVTVVLTKEGGARFEAVTERWVQRRLAIVLDGVIESAPVIKSKIAGGRLTISMGRGEPEKNLADARRLERSLRGKK